MLYSQVMQIDAEDAEQMAQLPRGRYDVVILLHVLEHLYDPVGTLRHLRTLAAIFEAIAANRPDEGLQNLLLTLRAVGARLGVSRTALYRHFADKGISSPPWPWRACGPSARP